ncbi:diphthine--ammonia ligase [Marinilabiliaceae bacterium JC017]|nr:diphthine--ammonia ligase [Marinilabiliaceae bacterium JC017]
MPQCLCVCILLSIILMSMKYIISWSGGKDCCLALHKAIKQYGNPVMLLSSVPVDEAQTLAHGYRESVLQLQAEAMDLPIEFMYFNGNYRQAYVDTLTRLKEEKEIEAVVYGDLYLEEHHTWLTAVCDEVGLVPVFPYWIKPEEAAGVMAEFLSSGIRAVLVNVDKELIEKHWLGKDINDDFARLAAGRYCPMGENGEFHSLVVDGPLFHRSLRITNYELHEDDKRFGLTINEIELV